MVSEHVLYSFNSMKVFKTSFMAWDMPTLVKIPCILEKIIYSAIAQKCPVGFSISPFIFCLICYEAMLLGAYFPYRLSFESL